MGTKSKVHLWVFGQVSYRLGFYELKAGFKEKENVHVINTEGQASGKRWTGSEGGGFAGAEDVVCLGLKRRRGTLAAWLRVCSLF